MILTKIIFSKSTIKTRARRVAHEIYLKSMTLSDICSQHPADIYLLKVNIRNYRTRCEISSNLL